MDKFSLKDSGRGDSEAGDSDYEPGRESPMDRLLGEGFTEIYVPDGQHRPHAGTSQALHPAHPTNPSLFTCSPELNINSVFVFLISLVLDVFATQTFKMLKR